LGEGNSGGDHDASAHNEQGAGGNVEPALGLAGSADEETQADTGDQAAEVLGVSS